MKTGNLSNAMCIFFEQIDLATATNYTDTDGSIKGDSTEKVRKILIHAG